MRVPKLLRTTALATSLIAASVPLSVPANAAWGGWHGGGWHGGGWGWGGVGVGLAAGALVGAALAAPYYGGYGYGYPAYGYGYDYPAYGYGYAPSYGYGYGPSYGYASAAPTTGYSTTRVARTSSNRNMYMQGDIHRGSKKTGSASSTQKFLNNQNSYR